MSSGYPMESGSCSRDMTRAPTMCRSRTPVAGARSRDVEVTSSTREIAFLRVTLAPDGKAFMVHLLADSSDWLVDVETGSARKLVDLGGEDLVFIQRRAP